MRRSPSYLEAIRSIRSGRLVDSKMRTQVRTHRREASHPEVLADRILDKRLDVGSRNHIPVATDTVVQLHMPLAAARRLVRTTLECRHSSLRIPIVGTNRHPVRFTIPRRKTITTTTAVNEMFLIDGVFDRLILCAIRSRQGGCLQSHASELRCSATDFRSKIDSSVSQVLVIGRMVADFVPLLGVVHVRLRIATEAHRIRTDKKRHRHIGHVVQEGQVVRLGMQAVIKRERGCARMSVPGNRGDGPRKCGSDGNGGNGSKRNRRRKRTLQTFHTNTPSMEFSLFC